MNIKLVNPPSTTRRTPEESLGLEYLVAETKESDYEGSYLDAPLKGLNFENTAKAILSEKITYLGFNPTMDNINICNNLVRYLRKNGFLGHIVYGGVYASFQAILIINEIGGYIDGVLSGEADYSFNEYINKGSLVGIPGSTYLLNDQTISEPLVCSNIELDSLPLPSRENLQLVRTIKTPSHIMGSRGCYGNCSFCSVNCFQRFSSLKKWRGRSPLSIVNELTELCNLGENMVKFVDDNFFSGNGFERELQIADLIINANLDLKFRISLRANDVNHQIIEKLKAAGLFAVSLGAESFVDRRLKFFNKGITVNQILSALDVLKKHDLYVQMGFILFDPFITTAELEIELDYLEKYSWTITKGICTELFVAEGTDLTKSIKNIIHVKPSLSGNYSYEIQDPIVHNFYLALKKWSGFLIRLYELIIDPISAPKNIPLMSMKNFHSLCIELKRIDISVALELLSKSKTMNLNDLLIFVDRLYRIFNVQLLNIKNLTIDLYKETGLTILNDVY